MSEVGCWSVDLQPTLDDMGHCFAVVFVVAVTVAAAVEVALVVAIRNFGDILRFDDIPQQLTAPKCAQNANYHRQEMISRIFLVRKLSPTGNGLRNILDWVHFEAACCPTFCIRGHFAALHPPEAD